MTTVERRCSYCSGAAVDYDALFYPWCHVCRKRKWLINWAAQHQWLSSIFEQPNLALTTKKDTWVSFVMQARDHQIDELWLRVVLFQKQTEPLLLGTDRTHLSLPPPDQNTLYNGDCFRNAWEGRWAIFFTNLQIPYHYMSGITGTPDELPAASAFWLPDSIWYRSENRAQGLVSEHSIKTGQHGAYFVVTGPLFHTREMERRAHALHFAQTKQTHVFFLEGRIGMSAAWDSSTVSSLTPSGEMLRPLGWYECLLCGAVGVYHDLYQGYRFCRCVEHHYKATTPRLFKAYLSARYAPTSPLANESFLMMLQPKP